MIDWDVVALAIDWMQYYQAIEYGFDERSDLYRRIRTTEVSPSIVLYARDEIARRISELAPCPCTHVTSKSALSTAARKPGVIVMVEADRLGDAEGTKAPCVAILAEAPELMPRLIRTLDGYPWVSHCLAEAILARPIASLHLAELVERVLMGTQWGMRGEVRVARLARASHRDARFERIRTFFSERGVSGRTSERIHEVYEELVTNALYDAPVEAKFFDRAVMRTEDVEMPSERACEISYGIEDAMAYLRVRDTFGSLSRQRLTGVLTRCNASGVVLDESRGGAGLGMWRVFSAASTVAITVDPGRLTEVCVGIALKDKRAAGPWAVDLYFGSTPFQHRVVDQHELLDQSVTLVRVAV